MQDGPRAETMQTPDAPSPRRRMLRPRLVVGLLLALLLAVALVALWGPIRDFVLDAVRTSRYVGLNWPKGLAFLALGVVFLAALPLSILDGVSSVRFRRAERDLRETLPDAAVQPYDGPEGRGLQFDAPGGRTLLLRPAGGLGAPRVMRLPAAEPIDGATETATGG